MRNILQNLVTMNSPMPAKHPESVFPTMWCSLQLPSPTHPFSLVTFKPGLASTGRKVLSLASSTNLCTEYHWYCYRIRLFQLMPTMYLRDWNPDKIWLLTTSEHTLNPDKKQPSSFTVTLPCQSLCSNVCQNWPSKPTTLLKKTASFGTHSWRKWYSNYIYWQGM